MPSLNFSAEFAELVETGRKLTTIRAMRNRPIYPGDWLSLWTGQRTKHCRKLGEATCLATTEIHIYEDGIGTGVRDLWRYLDKYQEYAVAVADGFREPAEMRAWFADHHGLPFEGQLIVWNPIWLAKVNPPKGGPVSGG